MNNQLSTMVGKWLLVEEGEYYQIGSVVALVGEFHFLIRLRPPNCPPFSKIYSIDQLSSDHCTIFDSETELDAWEAWLEAPDEKRPRVVNIKHTGEPK